MDREKFYSNDTEQVCSICGKKFKGFGNNAWPVNDGLCCDSCNQKVVIPRRMSDYLKRCGE